MIQLLHDKQKAAREKGETELELQVCELGDSVGIRVHGSSVNSTGEELVMSGASTVALFERIRDRCLIGQPHNPKPILPIYNASLRNLSDDGKRMIDLLPQEQLVNAFREVIETAEDPETPGTEEQKRDAIGWANSGINLLRNLAWLADKLKDGFS